MGSLISYFFGSSEKEQDIDPSTGLTVTQKKLVKDCWKIVDANAVEIGVELMITFFTEYPEYQEAFPKFRGRDLTELTKDRSFHAHCLGIMGSFSQAVEFIHDPELCVAGLHMVGERHARRVQDTRPFEVLEPIATRLLEKWLGSRYTREAKEALDIAISLLFKEIKRAVIETDTR